MKSIKLKLMLHQEHTYTDADGLTYTVVGDGAYGTIRRALDSGVINMSVLDVIEAEEALGLIREDDEAAWAAAILAMCGAKPAQLGGLFHPRLSKNRPGKRLLSDAISMVAARRRQQRAEADAKRMELRA